MEQKLTAKKTEETWVHNALLLIIIIIIIRMNRKSF
jgi:hypothetical protein